MRICNYFSGDLSHINTFSYQFCSIIYYYKVVISNQPIMHILGSFYISFVEFIFELLQMIYSKGKMCFNSKIFG